MPNPSVLIVDDEHNFREFLGEALASEGYRVELAATARAGLAHARARPPQIVLLDQNLPDGTGLDLLPQLRRLPSHPVIVMLTAYAEYTGAVDAVKAGAFHYIAKPFEFSQLLETLASACVGTRTDAEDASGAFTGLVGDAPVMRSLRRQIRQVAASPVASVLLQGESGTGKELVARAIHDLSARAGRRMVSVNCAALSESLLLSELFGHERGAFTDARERKKGVFEAADGGTLFLDEISEMGPRAQAALLRALEQRRVTRVGGTEEMPVDVRIVAATNRPLEQLVGGTEFRTDLYYRLNVIQLTLPPLRERGSDALLLARHFSEELARRYDTPVRPLTEEAEAIFGAYAWPGNVRELRNAIERAYVVGRANRIEPDDLPPELRGDHRAAVPGAGVPTAVEGAFQKAKQEMVELFERNYLHSVLSRTGGNVTRAAEEAGMLRQAFQKLLMRHGINSRDFRR